MQRIIAIDVVLAWRIQLMTLLGRALPDLPGGQLEIPNYERHAWMEFFKRHPHELDGARMA